MSKGLFLDFYELTMAQAYFNYKPQAFATFDLFIRSAKRPFYAACGIDDALKHVCEMRFAKEDIDYLRELKFQDDFLDYLKNFSFKGEIWAVEEPEIVFAQEPLVRVTANLIEAQLIEGLLLNSINLATTIATKACRIVVAAKGKSVYDFSLRRTQGCDAALASAKYSYIAGAKGTSNTYAGFLFKIPTSGTMAHSFVMSFDREIESFKAFAKTFPTRAILLVDTYDTNKGIESAVRVAHDLKKEGIELAGIRIDSGNIADTAHFARNLFDKEGMIDVNILASGNLDEFKIEKLLASKAPIDAFGVGTHMGCSSDEPYTDVIYKLVEIMEDNHGFIPTMKLSEAKTTMPYKKQIMRAYDKNNIMETDTIILDTEKCKGKKLLSKIVEGGKRILKEPDIEEKRAIFAKKIKEAPLGLLKNTPAYTYNVIVSKKLASLTEQLKEQIKKRILPKPVFFDIDTQYDFLDKKGALYVPNCEEIIAHIRQLKKCAQQKGIFVVSSQDIHESDSAEFKKFPPHCIRGTKGHKKITETLLPKYKFIETHRTYSFEELRAITRNYQQVILEKNVFDIFSNPNTRNMLETLYPDRIYVYGVATEYCIKETIEGLIKSGFYVTLVEDAVKEISKKEKEKFFSLWKKRGVSFINTKTLLQNPFASL
ncbi:MAG: nicotinate phosphoribosyltransferase [Candidatus Omnitrophica bacterium]|nr:nicotinate phosphoribosyltransferase [Candidatus Omnitrophota bacterium]